LELLPNTYAQIFRVGDAAPDPVAEDLKETGIGPPLVSLIQVLEITRYAHPNIIAHLEQSRFWMMYHSFCKS
jgi:hypothetical protein